MRKKSDWPPKRYYNWQERTHSKIFKGAPEQILALRKALGWTVREMALFMGLAVKRSDNWICESVRAWERGIKRPHPLRMMRLTQLAEMFRLEYQDALRHPGKYVKRTRKVPVEPDFPDGPLTYGESDAPKLLQDTPAGI